MGFITNIKSILTNYRTDIVIGLGLSILVAYALWPTLKLSFSNVDTPNLLLTGMMFSPWDYYTNPILYKFISPSNLTPGLTLTLDIDYELFGLDVKYYRLHQILSASILLVLGYVLMSRLSGSKWVAGFIAALLFLTPTTNAILRPLATRHYIEGGIFALLAIFTILHFIKHRQWRWLGLSALCYAIAMSYKEVYVPLPAILFFLRPWTSETLFKNLYKSSLLMIPYAIVLGLYLLWRQYMLGSFGGYALIKASVNWPKTFELFVKRTVYDPQQLWVPAIIFIAGIGSLTWQRKITLRHVGLSLSALLLALIPLYFLQPTMAWGFLAPRWFFVLFFILAILLCCIIANLEKPLKLLSLAALAIAFFPTIKNNVISQYYTIDLENRQKNSMLKTALKHDPNTAIYYRKAGGFEPAAFANYAHMIKIHTGDWGPLLLLAKPQSLYHDMKDMELIDPSGKALKEPLITPDAYDVETDYLKDLRYDPLSQMYTFDFNTNPAQKCWFYVYHEVSGYYGHLKNCQSWQIRTETIREYIYKMGNSPETAHIAFWRQEDDKFVVSPGYLLSELTDLGPLQIDPFELQQR